MSSGVIIYDQIVIVDPLNSQDRVLDVLVGDLSLNLFVNNVKYNWDILDGSSVLDSNISPGSIYFNEISGSPGFYSVRFYPDKTGYWYTSYVYSVNSLEIVRDYDLVPRNFFGSSSSGIVASFT